MAPHEHSLLVPRHSRAMAGLTRRIGGPFDEEHGRGGPGGWWILSEVDVALSEHDIVRPDVVGWKRERLRDPWDSRPIETTPDWICEILSPSNVAHDRVTKATLYLSYGLPYCWLLDPGERVLEAFVRKEDGWMRVGSYGATENARVSPFEAIELDLSLLFPPAEPA